MKALISKSASKLWLPNYFAKDVLAIDFKHLKKQGIKACLFDLDHTLLVHGTVNLSPRNTEHLRGSGMKIFIATNRRYTTALDDIAKELGVVGVMFAESRAVSKPSKKYYQRAVEMTGFKPEEVAMVGDRIVQDVWGARRAGVTAIMVAKFGKIKWYDWPVSVQDRLIPHLFGKHYKDI